MKDKLEELRMHLDLMLDIKKQQATYKMVSENKKDFFKNLANVDKELKNLIESKGIKGKEYNELLIKKRTEWDSNFENSKKYVDELYKIVDEKIKTLKKELNASSRNDKENYSKLAQNMEKKNNKKINSIRLENNTLNYKYEKNGKLNAQKGYNEMVSKWKYNKQKSSEDDSDFKDFDANLTEKSANSRNSGTMNITSTPKKASKQNRENASLRSIDKSNSVELKEKTPIKTASAETTPTKAAVANPTAAKTTPTKTATAKTTPITTSVEKKNSVLSPSKSSVIINKNTRRNEKKSQSENLLNKEDTSSVWSLFGGIKKMSSSIFFPSTPKNSNSRESIKISMSKLPGSINNLSTVRISSEILNSNYISLNNISTSINTFVMKEGNLEQLLKDMMKNEDILKVLVPTSLILKGLEENQPEINFNDNLININDKHFDLLFVLYVLYFVVTSNLNCDDSKFLNVTIKSKLKEHVSFTDLVNRIQEKEKETSNDWNKLIKSGYISKKSSSYNYKSDILFFNEIFKTDLHIKQKMMMSVFEDEGILHKLFIDYQNSLGANLHPISLNNRYLMFQYNNKKSKKIADLIRSFTLNNINFIISNIFTRNDEKWDYLVTRGTAFKKITILKGQILEKSFNNLTLNINYAYIVYTRTNVKLPK